MTTDRYYSDKRRSNPTTRVRACVFTTPDRTISDRAFFHTQEPSVISAQFLLWSEPVPRRSWKWIFTYWIGFCDSPLPPPPPLCGIVNRNLNRRESVNTEVNTWEWGWRFMLQTFSANRSSTILDVCERLVPVLVHTRPGYFFMSTYRIYSNKHPTSN